MKDFKISIRFFDDAPVRSVWDDASAKWWLCAVDVVAAIADTTNPRIYWYTVKRRNNQLLANCKQLKLPASDGKKYKTDVIDETTLNSLMAVIRSNKKGVFIKWLTSVNNSVDEKSKQKVRFAACSRFMLPCLTDCMILPGRFGQRTSAKAGLNLPMPNSYRRLFIRLNKCLKKRCRKLWPNMLK